MWGLHTIEHVYFARAAVSTSTEKFDGYFYNFTWKAWKRLNLRRLCSLWTIKFYTFAFYPCIFFWPPLHFSSLAIPEIKMMAKTPHATKLSTCTLDYSHSLNESITTHQQGTKYCSLHRLLHIRQLYLPCLLCSVAIKLRPPTIQVTLHACQHAPHYPLNCLPQPYYAHSKCNWGIVGKMAQDVGMLWKYCGVIPILFGCFLRVPFVHALFSFRKLFYVLLKRKSSLSDLVWTKITSCIHSIRTSVL